MNTTYFGRPQSKTFFFLFKNQSGKKVFPYILLSDEIGEQQDLAVSSHFIRTAQEAGGAYTMLW